MGNRRLPRPQHEARRHTRHTNLVVSKCGGHVELNPHVDGSCLIMLDEDGVRILFQAFQERLGGARHERGLSPLDWRSHAINERVAIRSVY
jgi:hypothetical protein